MYNLVFLKVVNLTILRHTLNNWLSDWEERILAAIKGGIEGMQLRPAKAQEKIIEPLVKAIVNLVNEGNFNPTNISQLARPIQLGMGMKILFKLLAKIGIVNFFWNQQFKKNNAYEKRFDRPFLSLAKESPTA